MSSLFKKVSFRIFTLLLACGFCLIVINIYYSIEDESVEEEIVLGRTMEYWQLYNDSINALNRLYAAQNPHGFTDKIRTPEKPIGVFRIAVLGDSFIWGDGMPYSKVWSHLLEEKVLENYDSIEVLSWGQNGWSTLDEFRFLKEIGIAYQVDLLLIGYVDNDLDMELFADLNDGRIRGLEFFFPKLAEVLPESYQQFGSGIGQLVYGNEVEQYNAWMDSLYDKRNLLAHLEMLQEFKVYCESKDIPVLILMTPNGFFDLMKERFEKVEVFLRTSGIPYLNLLPIAEEKLGHHEQMILNASPVNGHPGILFTQFFADEVFQYLVEGDYLPTPKNNQIPQDTQ